MTHKTFSHQIWPVLFGMILWNSAVANPQTADQVLYGWFEAAECTLTFDQFVEKSLAADGFSPRDMKQSIDALIKDRIVRRDVSGDFVLTDGELCAGSPVQEPEIEPDTAEAALILLLEENGCEMRQRALFEAALEQGLTREEIDQAGEGLYSQGVLVAGESGLRLAAGALCR